MNEQIEKLSNVEKSEVTFTPFGAADAIKLTVALVQRFVAVKTKSGKTCTNEDAVKFIALCQAQRLNPFAGDAFLVGYDGRDGVAKFSLITSHVAFIKRAETCQDYEGMESGIIVLGEDGKVFEREGDFKLPDENCVGGWARVHRKGRKPMYRRLAIEAMQPPYETPFWNKQKAPGQICKCAEADALRATFPTLIGGLYTEGESSAFIIDIEPKPKQALPTFAALPQTTVESPPPGQTKAPEQKAEPVASAASTAATTPSSDVSKQSPAAVSQSSEPTIGKYQKEFQEAMEGEGIVFDNFIRCEETVKAFAAKKLEASSFPTWGDIPEAFLMELASNPKQFKKIMHSAKAATT